ncbi:isoprenoid synthase domain-containing protein [Xylariaceae sp. FL0255]|nr:isoprenoid synthase domain-containing protein [Xylariaceae sp. FL0255]
MAANSLAGVGANLANPNASANLHSPNAIPPRTSSTGGTTSPALLQPAKSVLRPVPEGNWLAQTIHGGHRRTNSTASLFLTGMAASTGSQDPERYAVADLDFTSSRKSTWTDAKDKVLLGPYDYLDAQPGKNIRTLLINSFNAWLKVPQENLDVIAKVVAMLHTASLLIDDVEDSSLLRRGLPVSHMIFGTSQTINSANYVYFAALQELQKLTNPDAVAIFTEELLNLHRGQGMDLFWRDTLTCPTEEDYLEMAGNKTGGLFRLAIKLMQAESKTNIDCVSLVNLLGIIFQIQDDYRNLSSPVYNENKGFCEDLTEGKFSFLIIHSIRANPNDLQLLNILKQRTNDAEVKRYAVKYMEGTGTFVYTKKVLDTLIERARKSADEIDAGLGQSVGIHKILDKLAV